MQATIVSAAEVPAIVGTPFCGGFLAGFFQSEGKKFAIVTAPKDEGEKQNGQWNDSCSIVNGALSFFDGMENTQAMSEAGSNLAQWALGLNIGGYNDWHIPAQDVLEIIYRNLKPTTDENWCYARSGINLSAIEPTRPYTQTFPLQTVVDAFKQGGAEAFEQTIYWTSTQHVAASASAWTQGFDYGGQGSYSEFSKFSARAVRILEIQ